MSNKYFSYTFNFMGPYDATKKYTDGDIVVSDDYKTMYCYHNGKMNIIDTDTNNNDNSNTHVSSLKCECCGASLKFDKCNNTLYCEYCGTIYNKTDNRKE